MPARTLLADALLVDPEAPAPTRGSLLLDDGRILARLPADAAGPDDAPRVPLDGALLSPGLIDVHHHGELVLRDPEAAMAALRTASASLVRHGVTAFLPTTLAWPGAELVARVERIAAAVAGSGTDGAAWPGAVPLGIHLEGPWIREEAAGAQPRAGIRPYDAAEASALFDRAAGAVLMVTLAPEVAGADALMRELGRRGIAVAIGHTLAAPDQIDMAVAEGARHATHVFNAMGPLHQRGPGVAASILGEDRISCDVIADGAHVHPDWLRVAARAKRERLLLITDRIDLPAAADSQRSPDGIRWGEGGRIHSDGVAWRLADGRLAGSHLALHDAVRNCVRWKVMTRFDALRACTLAPARVLGIEGERGTLRVGARADLVLWSDAGEPLAIWVGGKRVDSARARPSRCLQ